MSFAVLQTSIWSSFHRCINFNINLRACQTISWILSIWLLLKTRKWSIRMELGLCGLAVFETIQSHKFYCFTVIDTWPGRCRCRLLVLKWVFLFYPTLGENIYTVAFFVGSRKWSPLFFYWQDLSLLVSKRRKCDRPVWLLVVGFCLVHYNFIVFEND